jgi:hypothetical protein
LLAPAAMAEGSARPMEAETAGDGGAPDLEPSGGEAQRRSHVEPSTLAGATAIAIS